MAGFRALSQNLRELRVHLCQTGEASAGLREFVNSMYGAIKTDNPTFPFLVREAAGADAKLIARYAFGVEESVVVNSMDKAAVGKALEALIAKGAK